MSITHTVDSVFVKVAADASYNPFSNFSLRNTLGGSPTPGSADAAIASGIGAARNWLSGSPEAPPATPPLALNQPKPITPPQVPATPPKAPEVPQTPQVPQTPPGGLVRPDATSEAAIQTQRKAQEAAQAKSAPPAVLTHPDATSEAAIQTQRKAQEAAQAKASPQLSVAGMVDTAKAAIGKATESLKGAAAPIVAKAAITTASGVADITASAEKSGVATDDLLGSMKERWGNIAVPIGLALMFFGGNTGMLAGGLLAAAGGANIYGRIKDMSKPTTGKNMQAMAALKDQNITPWTQQAYDVLAKQGVPPEEIATLRDVHAVTVLGGANTVYKSIFDEGRKRVAELTGNNPEALKHYEEGLRAHIQSLTHPALGAEQNYTGTQRGLLDKGVDWLTNSDSRMAPQR